MSKTFRYDNEHTIKVKKSDNPFKRTDGDKIRNLKANKATRKNYIKAA